MLMAARVSNCHSSLRFVVGLTGAPLLAASVCLTGLRALLDRVARGSQLKLFRRRIKQLTFVHCVKSSHVGVLRDQRPQSQQLCRMFVLRSLPVSHFVLRRWSFRQSQRSVVASLAHTPQ